MTAETFWARSSAVPGELVRAGRNAPLGEVWLPADGQWLREVDYPDLFAVLGHMYDDTDRPGEFRLIADPAPDFPGRQDRLLIRARP